VIAVRETAYAKINLALHVRARRKDGYHEIETLFAFVDQGDGLSAEAAAQDSVHMVGEFAGAISDPFSNLVARALNLLPRSGGLAVTLDKRLPVAAGLGGGSADAGAVFRLVREAHGLPDDWRARALKLGADVPACVESEACIGRGTGATLEPVANDLGGTPVLLVNPRVPLSTPEVFGAWNGKDRGPLPEGPASVIGQEGRNDLEAPAMRLCPFIGDVLHALGDTAPTVMRMSGSGASCFALYADEAARDTAAAQIATAHPEWWQLAGKLR
jgi:4-diphosphocytidyl-2-C-methyl-D-erythritol kinase